METFLGWFPVFLPIFIFVTIHPGMNLFVAWNQTRNVRRRGRGTQADLDAVIAYINESVDFWEHCEMVVGYSNYHYRSIIEVPDITPKQRRLVAKLLREKGYHHVTPRFWWWSMDHGYIEWRWD